MTMNKYHSDVLIIGAGSMGMAAGYYLAKKGIQTVLLDAYDPPHLQGSHHGDTRLYRYTYPDQRPFIPLALRALELWKELEAQTSEQILDPTGVLSIGIDGPSSMEDKLAAAREFSLPVERYSREEILKRWPGFVLPESAEGLLETQAGILYPEKAIQSYRQLALQEGAKLFPHTRVEKVTYHAHGVTVQTKDHIFTADKLLICAGAGNPSLVGDLKLPMRVMRKAVGWFETQGTFFHSPAFPGFVITKGTTDYYGFPDREGGGLKVGRHDGGQEVQFGHEIPPFGSFTEDEQDLRQCLDTYMPQASGQLLRGSTCLYTVTPDEHFIVDRHPNHSHVLLAAGFSGHGFKFVSALGEALSQFLVEGKPAIDLSLFSTRRFPSLEDMESRKG
ncbi:N-methyl-L-tryptophan oxidase [Ammoniphilus sp. CFH 90114]|uniref:N-methyl-L-tryptophan oxidase n=1 Tax=Ammoniphilus sp. CFH 90114 TaxID=2493665 RepID=UPI00100E0BAF|nr:N-methyl-L-tryptophan oxidase [Ammoniphilus sp. CFH 90114]RXT07072.1 N-methyl-L-tryptophan oxidase [Ammoniphilus sp. CFH 90114]